MRLKPYEIQSVSIRFKVWVPVLNRSTTRLYLLGSVKELGAWSMNAAIEATPTKEPHIWTTEAQLTPRSRFEWVWLKIDRKSKKVDWERQVKRYRELDYFSGVIHSVWGEQDEIFFQNSANVEFTTYKKVDEGYVLVITGGAPTLGSWNIQKAIVANEFPYQSGYWKVDVLFDALSRIDFRWAVVKEDDRQNVLVQEKISHQLMGRPTWMRVAAPWMTTGAIVVDTLPLQEILDTKMGRTDILVRDKRTRLMEIKNWLVKFRNPQARPVYSRPSSVLDAENMPSALRALVRSSSMSNWEDENQEDTHLRQSSSLSKTERLSKKLGKDAQKISPVFAIKGKGQTELPTDFANTDIANQVPLWDCGFLFLVPSHITNKDYLEEARTAYQNHKTSKEKRSSDALSRSNIDTTDFYPSKQKSADVLKRNFAQVDKQFQLYSKKIESYKRAPDEHYAPNLNDDMGGTPQYEGEVDRVSSAIPMTFTMLAEMNVEDAKNPNLSDTLQKESTNKKELTRRLMVEPIWEKPSLTEVFQWKNHNQRVVVNAAAARGRFVIKESPSKSTAFLGKEDTLKTVEEIQQETENRAVWDNWRNRTIVYTSKK